MQTTKTENKMQEIFKAQDILALATMSINSHGWVSNTAAKQDGDKISTYSRVMDVLMSESTDIVPSENETKFAGVVINWLNERLATKANDPSVTFNDYEMNLMDVAKKPELDSKREIALFCSAVNYYNKEYLARMNAHKGFLEADVGTKVSTDLRIVSKNIYESRFGTMLNILAEDKNFKFIKFSTSSGTKLWGIMENKEAGESIKVNGIVKNKETFRENEYTVLTRVNIV